MARRRVRPEDYTVELACALPVEYAASLMMLDEYEALPYSPDDPTTYSLGVISGHKVVITCLPADQIGTLSVAPVVGRMKT